MQPADLAEIEGNDLAQATMSLVDRIRPHLTMLAVAVGVAFAGLAAWTLVSSQRDAERAQAWDACLTAVASRDAVRLGDVAARYPGSAAAVWSQILLADSALAEGGRLVLVDKTRGRERLQAAAELYAGVMGQKPAEMAAERAVFGLARARESLGDLEAAKSAKASADAAVVELTAATRQAQVTAQAEIAGAVAAASEAAAAQAATLNARLEKQLADAEGRINAARAAAVGALRSVATDTAAAVVTRLVGIAPSAGSVEQAVDAALAARRA